jgi:hypothetical protein
MLGFALLLPLTANAASTQSQAPAASGTLVQTITNDPTTVNGVAGVFNGTVTITQFVNQAGQLVGIGTVTGTVTNATGTLATLNDAAASVPIASAVGSCTILTLDTGAIHLDLLGLVVDLSPIHLNITAQQGAGNLLGNLLCAITNLLNGGSALGDLSSLLNQILSLL